MVKKTLTLSMALLLAAPSTLFASNDAALDAVTLPVSTVDTVLAAATVVTIAGAFAWAMYYVNTHADENTARTTAKLCKKLEKRYGTATAAELYHDAHVEVVNAGTGIANLLFRPRQSQETRILAHALAQLNEDLGKLFKHEKNVQDLLRMHQKEERRALKGDTTIDIEMHRQAEHSLELQLATLRTLENKLITLINELNQTQCAQLMIIR